MKETKEEERWNTLTHFIGLICSLIGFPILLKQNNNLTDLSTESITIYAFGLICLYAASTLYHYTNNIQLKQKFRIFDHISIYYLIAGSYAPICLITLYQGIGVNIFISILVLALFGSLFKIFYTGKFEKISLFFYLTMGWLIVLDIKSVINLVEFNGILLIVLGGLFYSFGTVFYRHEKLKYSHAIWHVFVLIGSALHYFSVLLYVI